MKFKTKIFTFLSIASCSQNMAKISGRSPELFEKQREPFGTASLASKGTSTELYIKEPRIVIKPANRAEESGSLASPEDDRLHLFTDSRPMRVGRIIPIKVVSNKSSNKKEDEKTKSNESQKQENTNQNQNKDPLEEELLKSIPQLKPSKESEKPLVSQFKMKVLQVYPNGDVLARLTRKSSNSTSQEEFTADARIPNDKLSSGEPLTTADLVDIKIYDSTDQEGFIRESIQWEDEFSLRLSGFTEAKSQAAYEIEEKRKELEAARTNMEQRIKSFANEKRKFANERSEGKNKQENVQSESSNAGKKSENQSGITATNSTEKKTEKNDLATPSTKQNDPQKEKTE